MGQSMDKMNLNQNRNQSPSKEELVYQCVTTSNIDAIKALHLQGATLEWMDGKGKTPLIVASMDSGLINVAKTLIQLGANINAYRPGSHGGTPLHHAAKRGLESTVKLLLSCRANVLMRNDDGQTALDVARTKGHTGVVRVLEGHMCYFSGWLREFYGPGFLEALAPHLLTRKIWAVVVPCGSGNPMKPLRFELAIYPTLQDALPHTVISLSDAKIDEPKFHQPDPTLTIFDQSRKIRHRLSSANEGDKQQLQWLCNACRGIRQVMPSVEPNNPLESFPAIANPSSEATRLAAENISQTASANGWDISASADTCNGWGSAITHSDTSSNGWIDEPKKPELAHSKASSSGWTDEPEKKDYNGWGVPSRTALPNQNQVVEANITTAPVIQTSNDISSSVSSAPSAPPIPDEISSEGPIYYPSVENSKLDLYVPAAEHGAPVTSNKKDEHTTSSCVICWEAPIEAACVPCGHMAGCMSCLKDIKAKRGNCPVCRSKISQVIRLYTV